MAYQRSLNESKYDRQMRLWGSHGQRLVEECHLLIFGSSALCSETMKNLVLPNVGHFTVVDDSLITQSDLSNNFFLSGEEETVGKERGREVVEYLLEMNKEVKGEYIHCNPMKFIEDHKGNQYEYFNQYHLIISTQLNTLPLLPFYDSLYDKNIPLIVLNSIGFIGKLRTQINCHNIIETHPTNDRYDFYIHPKQSFLFGNLGNNNNISSSISSSYSASSSPSSSSYFPELNDYINSFAPLMWSTQRDGNTTEDHAHIPSLVILSLCIQKYFSQNPTISFPFTSQQKKSFKQFIIDSSWNYGEEGNFQEAYDWAMKAYEIPTLDGDAKKCIYSTRANKENLSSSSFPFFILCNAVREFIDGEGKGVCLPISMDLPDMHCKTSYYLKLKEIFKNKFSSQCDQIYQIVENTMKSLSIPTDKITKDDVIFFVKNVRNLKCIESRRISEEYNKKTFLGDQCNEQLEEENMSREMAEMEEKGEGDGDEEMKKEEGAEGDKDDDGKDGKMRIPNPPNLYWYFSLRSYEIFLQQKGFPPGHHDETWEEDCKNIESLTHQMISEYQITEKEREVKHHTVRDTSIEMSRYGGTELHNTSAFMGGIGAQEALKIILKQYVPINNTFLYNGIHCTSNSWEM